MAQSSEYELWFGNQSINAGTACVYQNETNVTANMVPKQLAWMVHGANASTWIQFKWSLDYAFLWIDQGPPKSQQIVSADLATSNSIALGYNRFGFTFSGQGAGTEGKLSIREDSSVPAVNKAIAGIGMSRAGTFAAGASPNQTLFFTPAPVEELRYSITFGQYTFQVGDVLDTTMLNSSGLVRFPSGVFAMTAILSPANQWTVTPGRPMLRVGLATVIYKAGRGVVVP